MMIVIVVVVIVVVVMFAAAGVAAYELTIHKPTFQSGLLGRCGKRWRLGMCGDASAPPSWVPIFQWRS